MLEPIEVVLLKQKIEPLAVDHPLLEAPKQSRVIARQLLLQGRYSATVYTYAVSLLMLDQLPTEVRRQLDIEPGGIGRILLNSQLENRREVLWYGYEHLTDLPEDVSLLTGTDFISRTYRIIAGGIPIMLINEKFPIKCMSRL